MSRAMEREYQPCLISRCLQSKSNKYLPGRNKRLGLKRRGRKTEPNTNPTIEKVLFTKLKLSGSS